MTTMKKGNGWHMPPRSRKFHFYKDSRSLCGKYGFMVVEGDEDTGYYDSNDCKKCVAELKKLQRKNE